MKKKLIIPVLVATMLGTSIPAYAANFADINDVPWEGAKTYINAVADKGLMVGSDNAQGKRVFKPKDNLSYLECAQLVYTLFGDESGLTAYNSTIGTKWNTVLKGYKISEWAWPATSFCLENGIVTISDVASFMNGTTAKKAARQDVAVMFGKGFEKAGYSQKQSFSFNDASKISSSALKYANLLGSLNILTGDGNKNFNPTALINRSEMAVIVSKTDDLLADGTSTGTQTGTTTTPTGSGTITGVVSTVVSYGNQYVLTMLTGEGAKSFMMSASTKVNYNNKVYGPEDIGESDTVVVAYNGTTVVTVVVTKDANDDIGTGKKDDKKEEKAKETYSGVIYSMNDDRMVVKKSSSSKQTYTGFDDDNSDVEVIIDGTERSYSRLLREFDDEDREKDIKVVVYINDDDEVYKIIATVDGGEAAGDVDSASETKVKIDGDTYYFHSEEDLITIKINGYSVSIKEFVDAYEEYEDFYAEAVLDGDDKIITLTITSDDYEGGTISGVVDNLSSTRIKVDGEWYDFPDDVTDIRIKLNGSTIDLEKLDEAYEDLESDEDMTVDVVLDSEEKVSKITATTKVEKDEVSGDIKSVSSNKIKIGSKNYDVEDNGDYVDVDIENGNKDITTYEDLENFVTDLDRDVSSYKITVEAVTEDGNVTEIKGYVAEIDGVYVYDASYSNDTITLAIADTNYKFKVDGGCTIKEEGTSRSRDLENIEDALVDDDVYATSIEIDEEGYVTSIKYEVE